MMLKQRVLKYNTCNTFWLNDVPTTCRTQKMWQAVVTYENLLSCCSADHHNSGLQADHNRLITGMWPEMFPCWFTWLAAHCKRQLYASKFCSGLLINKFLEVGYLRSKQVHWKQANTLHISKLINIFLFVYRTTGLVL